MSTARQSRRDEHSSAKSHKVIRVILSFLLFICLTALSLSVCIKSTFVNPNTFVNVFTDKEYISSLHSDILQYSYDLCNECAIPFDSVDKELDYDAIYNLEMSFIAGTLGTSPQYNKVAFDENINSLNKALVSSTNKMIGEYGLKTDLDKSKNVKAFSNKITDYARQKIQFKYIDKLETITGIGKTVTTVLLVVLAIITCVGASILFFTGSKRYRSVRSIAYSFLSSFLMNMVLVFGLELIKTKKTLVIYPTYLCSAVMNYVNLCEMSVAIAGAVMFFVSILIIAVEWKMKRDDK